MQEPWQISRLPMDASKLFGRAKELHDISQCLEEHRFVEIRGGPGEGKTELALIAAQQLLDGWRKADTAEAVYMVDFKGGEPQAGLWLWLGDAAACPAHASPKDSYECHMNHPALLHACSSSVAAANKFLLVTTVLPGYNVQGYSVQFVITSSDPPCRRAAVHIHANLPGYNAHVIDMTSGPLTLISTWICTYVMI